MLVLSLAAVRWIYDHPFGEHWDEALYFNQVLDAIWTLRTASLRKIVGGVFLIGDPRRPPAYRLIALPFVALFGYHIAVARLVTLALFTTSAYLLYKATARISNKASGAFALLVFALCPEVVAASIDFSTEGPMFLAISAMLYFLSSYWVEGTENSLNWFGLGLAIGLGILSKASFVLVAFPILAYTIFATYKRTRTLSFTSWLKAAVVTLFVAGPWWAFNIRRAFAYARFAMRQPRNSLGEPSPHVYLEWLSTIAQGLFGHGLTLLIVSVLLLALFKLLTKRGATFDPVQRMALIACACGVIPLVIVQLAGTNQLLRYLTPTLIPLAMFLGIAADKTGWTWRWPLAAVAVICFSVQLGMLVYPVIVPNNEAVDPGFANGALPWRVMIRFDQWDWKPLMDVADNCGLGTPLISYLGDGRAFNPPQLMYYWILQDKNISEPHWLWRYEEGPLDWQKVMTSVESSDIVLTAPNYVGQPSDKQDLDNQHNAEFVERMNQDSHFRLFTHLKMGRFEPVDVVVFTKRTLACH
jgi:4-amino-4-deoxy-L-arabinose transferase-like glycosyltransferase